MKTRNEKIQEFLGEQTIDIDLCQYFQSDIDFNQFNENVLQGIREEDVIYYHKAMEFLLKNDPSLKDSLEIAGDLGFETNQLNSEILATLLYQEYLGEQYSEIQSDIEDFFLKVDNVDLTENETIF